MTGAIVLAGGSGRRMEAKVPKQYLPLAGHPVLHYSLKAFEECALVDEIVLVTGQGETEYCRRMFAEEEKMGKISAVVEGGRERYDSVLEGLKASEGADYVLIHDGARPLVTEKIIVAAVLGAMKYGACAVGMPVKDTIKIVDGEQYAKETPDRSYLWQIQTPQGFSYPLIRRAYDALGELQRKGGAEWDRLHITDDAMVAETFLKRRVKLIEGDYTNIKLTTSEDLVLAEALLRKRYIISRE